MKIEIVKTKAKKPSYFWRIVARNGKTLAHSEVYNSKQGCEKTAVKVRNCFHNSPASIVYV